MNQKFSFLPIKIWNFKFKSHSIQQHWTRQLKKEPKMNFEKFLTTTLRITLSFSLSFSVSFSETKSQTNVNQ